eukprot:3287341-Rhodomonas_salina.1
MPLETERDSGQTRRKSQRGEFHCCAHPSKSAGSWLWKIEATALAHAQDGHVLVKTENKAPWKNFLWMTDAKTMIEKEDLEEPWRLGKDPTRKNINMTASMTAS